MKKQVVIIGGGPAGLFSALKLSQNGHQVTVIEKSIWPVEKLCGEGIMPRGREILEENGLVDVIDHGKRNFFRGIAYISKKHHIKVRFRDGRAGVAIERKVFANMLFQQVSRQENIRLLPNHHFKKYHKEKELFYIDVKDDVTGEEIKLGPFDILIGADGRLSKVRKQAELDADFKLPYKRIGVRSYYKISPWTDLVEVWWGDGLEAYVTPIAKDKVSVIFGWDTNEKSYHRDSLLEHIPGLASKLKDVELDGKSMVLGNLAHRAQAAYKDNLFLVGDSFTFLDGITGEGITLALTASKLLVAAIESGEYQQYNKKMMALSANYIRFTSFLIRIMGNKISRYLVLATFNRFPFIFRLILAYKG